MRKPIRFAALAAALAASLFAALMPSANADTFYPEADAPTQEVLAFPKALQPAYPSSTSIYTVTVAVGSQGGVNNLDYVEMCWFKDTNSVGDSTGLTAENCGQDDINGWHDPRTQFSMRWSNWHYWEGIPAEFADEWFSVAQSSENAGWWGQYFWTNNYVNDGSTSGFGDGTGNALNIAFRFRISDGMLQGNDWNVVVRAADVNGNMTPQVGSNISVAYFGSVIWQRDSVWYGNLSADSSSLNEELYEGDFIANDASYITYQATPFYYNTGSGVEEIPLATGPVANAPGAGQAAFDCNADWWWNEGSATRLSTVPQQVRSDQLTYGTGEWADNYNMYHSCRIWYGGGAPVASQTYQNTFTAGIGQMN